MKDPRIFPLPHKDLYKQDDETWVCKLAWHKYPLLQRTLAFPMTDTRNAIGLICHTHRIAIEMENRGEWSNADFFFEKAYGKLAKLTNQQWRESLQSIEGTSDTGATREQFAIEWLMDTHVAMYKGLVELSTGEASLRASEHLDWAAYILSNFVEEPAREKLREVIALIAAHQPDKSGAITACEVYLTEYPDDIRFSRLLKKHCFDSALNGLKKDAPIYNINHLNPFIEKEENLLVCLHDDVELYDMLGQLYFTLGINQVNNYQVSNALISLQKAISYCPYIENAQETLGEVINLMKNLIEHNKHLNEQLRNTPNAYLTEDGQKIQREALHGFGQLNLYLESQEHKDLINTREHLSNEYPNNNEGMENPYYDAIPAIQPEKCKYIIK